jgi:hypothetical protein
VPLDKAKGEQIRRDSTTTAPVSSCNKNQSLHFFCGGIKRQESKDRDS